MEDKRHDIGVSGLKTVLFLAAVAVFMTVVSGVSRTTPLLSGVDRNRVFSLLFVNQDDSIPSYYSALLLLACSVAVAAIAHDRCVSGAPHRFGWVGLSVIFAYLSVDEAVSIHEGFTLIGRSMLEMLGADAGVPIKRAWVVPGILVLLVVAAIYARFFFALPGRTKLLFLLSFFVFFGGAVGMEIASDVFVYLLGGVDELTSIQNVIRTVVFTHIEELMEMFGSITFLYTFLDYGRRSLGSPVYSFRVEK